MDERYDVEEMSKYRRMANALGLDDEDREVMSFLDVEAEYLDAGFPEIVFD